MIAAPFVTPPYEVRSEWIDDNGHLNLAYYLVLFDWATDALWAAIGLGDGLRAAGHGTFAAESHILYRAELVAGEERGGGVDRARGRRQAAAYRA